MAKALLTLGADINAPASATAGLTAVQAAAVSGSMDLVKLFLSCGAEINAPACKYKGLTALQATAFYGHDSIVTMLLDNGADVNAPGSSVIGGTALHAAAEAGHEEIVQRLLDHGADVNSEAGWYGQTALQIAAAQGNEGIVHLLREKGAKGTATGKVCCLAIRIRCWLKNENNRYPRLKQHSTLRMLYLTQLLYLHGLVSWIRRTRLTTGNPSCHGCSKALHAMPFVCVEETP